MINMSYIYKNNLKVVLNLKMIFSLQPSLLNNSVLCSLEPRRGQIFSPCELHVEVSVWMESHKSSSVRGTRDFYRWMVTMVLRTRVLQAPGLTQPSSSSSRWLTSSHSLGLEQCSSRWKGEDLGDINHVVWGSHKHNYLAKWKCTGVSMY